MDGCAGNINFLQPCFAELEAWVDDMPYTF
jgi:hypothetical protein